ncbi:hypothetical protein [Burkholderia sp. BE17]|uniref:hypothetical protein n=1 Tax=Burkholderia sp. BE17 TaxID=2656644 RepID=UPI001D11ACDA|nr:hypothetical protein [Burkholderia sp. BE17]
MSNARVQALSLEGHIALSVLRSGHGDALQIGRLSQIVYLAYFMRDVTAAGSDLEQFRTAESIVEYCVCRALGGGQWELREEDYAAIERILLLYDAQLAAAPAYRFVDAWQQFQRVIVKNLSTPIEGSRIEEATVGIEALSSLIP